ncbi:hypothetical protein A3860_35970 [Niastella vici]|uniref:Uncharacterized protein n=1 Tax=Niastella vici TaxID=1703345 RepID=A0A1V9FNR7_9BACT|nr:hypothetical protein [Niastella vici]OQP59911.1 hypothetical protein A3860_35970 [Niastella vici]
MKKYFFSLAALALAIGFSSFTGKRAIDQWFSYTLSTNTGFDVPSNYNSSVSEPSNPGGDNNVVNAIKVDSGTEVYGDLDTYPGKPKVDVTGSGTINAAISSAISSHTEQANRVTLKP